MKMKKNKQKTVALRRYKKSSSRTLSNCSLAQLLHTASLKKRINDLTKNNRLLTTALQESRIEAAVQGNLLKNYAKDSNQILFARIKLNEMAKNLATFATDLEKVRSNLDVSLPSDYDFFPKGSCNGRIVKAPDVSCIDEASELSENDVTTACENSSCVLQSNLEENMVSVSQNIEMTPILYAEEIQKKRSNNKGSITPELNVDLDCVKQKRPIRSRRSTSSLEKQSSSLGELITHEKDVSPPLMLQEEDLVQMNKIKILQIPSDVHEIKKEYENSSILSFQNFSDEPMSISHSDCSSVQSSDVDINIKTAIVSNDLPSELNNSVLVCEDKKLKSDICIVKSPSNKNNSPFVANLEDSSKIHICVQEESINCINNKSFPESDSTKLSDNSQTASSLLHDVHLSEINEYDEEIQNVGSLTFCESDDDDEKKNTVSPFIKRSRSKKPVKYTGYFSSDDSDIDSPFKKAVKKRNSNRKIKLSSTPNGKLCEKTSTEVISSDVTNDIPEIDYSVFNLDVSNSKKVGKKNKKSSSVKSKNKKVNNLPKPLSQKCSVTKLKAGKFKFSKCISPSGILKMTQPSLSQADKDNRNEAGNMDNIEDNKQQLQTPKRVSFAPLDIVCNFARMSESKTIADNKKVRRTSKSIIDFKQLCEEEGHSNISPTSTDNSPERPVDQKLNNSISFGFSADTEMYALTLPSNTSIFPTDALASSNSPTSLFSEQIKLVNNRNDKHVKKSPEKLSSPKNVKRLSLKQNRITPNKSLQYISGKAENEGNILLLESPLAIVKPPKRTSLFKESPDDDLKENTHFDHPPSEKKDSLNLKIIEKYSNDSLKENINVDHPFSENKEPVHNEILKDESSEDEMKENRNSDYKVSEKEESLKNIIHAIKNSPLSIQKIEVKKSSYSKSENKVHSKTSLNKKKKSNPEIKSLEHSPVLIDATNLNASTDENLSRRRSKPVSYKEPSLIKKLRRN